MLGESGRTHFALTYQHARVQIITAIRLVVRYTRAYLSVAKSNLDNLSTPIDPFSEAYWIQEEAEVDTTEVDDVNTSSRHPLQSMLSPNGNTILAKPTPSLKTATSTPKVPKTPGKLLSGEELEKFKQEVEGSTVNKAALLGLLKHA